MYSLTSERLTYQEDRIDLASPNGVPTVLLIFDDVAMARHDIAAIVRDRRLRMDPAVNLLVLAPEGVGQIAESDRTIHAAAGEIHGVMHGFGVASSPATVIADSSGAVVWSSEMGDERARHTPSTDDRQGHVSGAVGLGDLQN